MAIKVGDDDNAWLRFALFVVMLSLFYLNYFLFIPRLFLKQGYGWYFLTLLSVYAFIFILMITAERFLGFNVHPDNYLGWIDFIGLSILLTVYVMAVGSLQLFKSWILNQIRYRDLENASLRIKLDQLESQINPHFLFNMLNNIHLLINEDPQKADEMLIHLSDILRHQLYVTPNGSISLEQEIKILQSILHLEQIRRESFLADIRIEGNPDKIKIPPFMFIAFVENAIKHGRPASSAFINYDIKIVLSIMDNYLVFVCSNPIRPWREENSVGVGLKNIRKRLEILFPNKHELIIQQYEQIFEVHLKIPIRYQH